MKLRTERRSEFKGGEIDSAKKRTEIGPCSPGQDRKGKA